MKAEIWQSFLLEIPTLTAGTAEDFTQRVLAQTESDVDVMRKVIDQYAGFSGLAQEVFSIASAWYQAGFLIDEAHKAVWKSIMSSSEEAG